MSRFAKIYTFWYQILTTGGIRTPDPERRGGGGGQTNFCRSKNLVEAESHPHRPSTSSGLIVLEIVELMVG
jgi:hypothetical protein